MSENNSFRTGDLVDKYFVIKFEDAEKDDEIFTDRAAATRRYEQVLNNWNCYLFVEICIVKELEAQITAKDKRDKMVHAELSSLALSLHKRHYSEAAPNFELLEDSPGIATQIDNMICGLNEHIEEQAERIMELKEQLAEEELPALNEALHDRSVRIEELEDKEADHQTSFDLRYAADMRGIKLWQEAHPGKELTWPDHADLVVHLMERLDAYSDDPRHYYQQCELDKAKAEAALIAHMIQCHSEEQQNDH